MDLGRIVYGKGKIILNDGKRTCELVVKNVSNRPIQISSHYPFYEVNKELLFDRDKSFGMRLDIPAGDAIRFEAGEEKVVRLVEFSGQKRIMGFNNLINGQISESSFVQAKMKAREKGYKGA